MPSIDESLLIPLGPEDPQEVSGYRLLAKVGEGGMGAVYLSQTRGNQPVALKVIRREFAQNADFRARFEREVQAASQVSGYHIVPVLDHDMNGEQPWIATSYVPGLPLDEALARFGPLPLSATFQLISCTAQALSSVHAASVIHRDLKPSNILLSSKGPWVIDFGIARATDATQLTQTGGFIGTPQYMSPEHALGKAVTGATDIFALGLIAAVVATGRHPYGDGSGISIAATIANTDQRPPDLSGYPDALREVLARCLAPDPAQRPGPAALADWCEQALGRQRRDFAGWLPAPLAAEIAGREEASRRPPQPAAPAPSPVRTPTQAIGGAPATTPTPAYAAPTEAAAPPQTPRPHSSAPGAVASSPRRRQLIIGGAVLALVATAGVVWTVIPGGDDSAGKHASTKTRDHAGSGPSNEADAPVQAGYRLAFEDKPISLGYPSSLHGFSNTDLDVAVNDKNAPEAKQVSTSNSEITMWSSEILFRTTFGKSLGVTPQECSTAPKSNPIPHAWQARELGGRKRISQGDLLCTVTSNGNLALFKITEASGGQDGTATKSGVATLPQYKGLVTLWKPVSK
ncbi:serine/threonine-protein kinase [Streptomyces sp. NPDC048483]|uniref:serine/threonine-protein kinase n=1 Tax=Streptomyces sp. NPDC048483 TaxID=3154927 RepID=UPI0034347241